MHTGESTYKNVQNKIIFTLSQLCGARCSIHLLVSGQCQCQSPLLSFTDLCFFAILYHFELHQATHHVMLPKAIALLPTPAVHEFCYFAIVYHFELHQATHYALVLKMAAVAVARKMWEVVVVPLVPNVPHVPHVPNVHPIQLE